MKKLKLILFAVVVVCTMCVLAVVASTATEQKPTSGSSDFADYVYDEATGKATITIKNWGDALCQTGWTDIVNAWKDDITTIEFVSTNWVTKLESTRSLNEEEINIKEGAIVGFSNLETIIIDAKFTELQDFYIQNNPKLKTFGPSGTEEGTFDLSQFTKINGSNQIAAWSFKGNSAFTSLVLPTSTITTISWEAFENCTGIGSIVIPEACTITAINASANNDTYGWLDHAFNGLTEAVTIYNEMADDTLAQELLALLPDGSAIYVPEVNDQVDGDKTNDNDLTWAFDAETGTLTINGTSAAVVYGAEEAPWADNKTSIKTVVINAPITTTLYTMFSGYTALESVTLPQELTAFGPMTFDNCKALRELKINGISPDGVIDLRKFSFSWNNTTGGWQLLQGAVADGATIWLPKTLDGGAFYNSNNNKFGVSGRTYNFVVYPGATGSESSTYTFINANKLNQNLSYTYYTEAQDKAMYDEYMANVSATSSLWSSDTSYDFDLATGTLTIKCTKGWDTNIGLVELSPIVTTWKYAIKKIVIPTTQKLVAYTGGNGSSSYLSNLPNLEEFIYEGKTVIRKALFNNNPKLTTIGNSSNVVSGVVNLSAWNVVDTGTNETTGSTLYADIFANNTGFTKVILPTTGASNSLLTIAANAFAGCTNINAIVIPENCSITTIEDGAFDKTGVPVTIYNEMADDTLAQALLALLPEGSVIKEKVDPSKFNKSVTFEGWSVRTASYNGLRGIFSHNKSVTNEGWTLAEYGALLAATAKKNAGGIEVTYDIATNKSSFKDYVKHFEICVTGENGLERTDKLILNTSDDNKTDFAVSIINYKSYYMIDVYMAGYEIWVRDGEYIVLYTDYADSCGDETYVDTSIYEVSLGMYKSGFMNAEKDAENIVWDSLVAGGALELTKDTGYTTTDDYTDGEAINMKTGEPFGDKFVVANVPLVNQAREEVDGVDTLVFTDAGTTYTILNDCFNPGKYVLIYRDDPAAPGTEIPGADLENGYRGQIYSKWYTDWAVTPIVKVSASRPNPVYASSVYNNCATVIIDHGITGTGMQAFGHSGGVTFMYHETFKNIASATWLDATKVTTIHLAQPDNKDFEIEEGLADISSVESVDPAILFKNTKITAVHMPDSSKWVKDENGDISVSKEFAQREVRDLPAFKTLWCGDGTRKDGEINLSNTEVVTIGSNAFANKYSDEDAATTVNLPATATSIDDSAFTATEITIDHGTAYSGTIATYCETKGYTYNAGTPVVEANTGWSMIVF